MSKVFTPEKVRALALKIWSTGNNVTLFQEVITEWLDQKPIEPVVVGLRLRDANLSSANEKWNANPEQISNEELLYSYQCLYDDYQSLIVDKMLIDKEHEQLKSQQSTPNWDDVPDAVMRNVVYEWYAANGALICSIFERNELRPQPMPPVEVGQVWEDESTKVKVGCLGRVSKNGEESIAFVDMDTNELKTWMLKTFLAKFERVHNEHS